MSLITHLQRQFAYDSWANGEEARLLSTLSDPPATAIKLLNHIVAAQWLWLDRLQQNAQRTAVWPELSLADCAAQLQALDGAWQNPRHPHAAAVSRGVSSRADLYRGAAQRQRACSHRLHSRGEARFCAVALDRGGGARLTRCAKA